MRPADADDDVIAAFMRDLAAEPGPRGPLPDVQAVLRRARLRERLEAEQHAADRVARPMLAAGLLGPFLAGIALAVHPGDAGAAVTAAAGLLTAAVVILGVRLALIED
jgi:hypothetical protein